jgi:hypothetical protein
MFVSYIGNRVIEVFSNFVQLIRSVGRDISVPFHIAETLIHGRDSPDELSKLDQFDEEEICREFR